MAVTAAAAVLVQLAGSAALQLPAAPVAPRHQHRPTPRARCPRCDAAADGEGADPFSESIGDFSFSALRKEAERRSGSDELGNDLGKFMAMHRIGPHHTTTPKEVVQHVITELREGNVSQAFSFTCVPVTKRGTHKSSTDWSQRMTWDRCKVINDAPSGGHANLQEFESMVRSRYAPLLETEEFRFVGDDSPWQQKRGQEKMTAVKDYVVEVKTRSREHLLLKFKLVYDWLVFCHLVARVDIMSIDALGKHFPGADESVLDI